MKNYWIASFLVVLAFTVGLSFVTEYYWLAALVLAGFYVLCGVLARFIGEDENSALQTETTVVE